MLGDKLGVKKNESFLEDLERVCHSVVIFVKLVLDLFGFGFGKLDE